MKKGYILLILLLLSSCTGKTIGHKQLTTIDSREIEYASAKQNLPTIIFINGGGAASMDSWVDVYPAVSEKYSVFAYNRFGVGNSSSDERPQSVALLSETLHKLLKKESINPPYILVGHSMGGLIANYYARLFSAEVKGVILVDSTHPNQTKVLKNDSFFFQSMLKAFKLLNPSQYSELSSMDESSRQISNAEPFPNIPLVVITAGERAGQTEEQKQIIDLLQQDLATLSSQGKQIIVPKSGHFIQKDSPQIVIHTIEEIANSIQINQP